nr:MAG TPA: hypothetical protein [Caudoviricetes sp.]
MEESNFFKVALFSYEKFSGLFHSKEKLDAVWQICNDGVINIIPITKGEAHKLHKIGIVFGDYGISSTHTKHKKFFLTETKKNTDTLNTIRGKASKSKRVGV